MIILIALAYVYQGPLKKWQAGFGQPENFLAGIRADAIDKIEMTRDGKTVTLKKEEGRWKIAETKDFYAKSAVIATLLDDLRNTSRFALTLVSANKDKKKEFQTDESGTEVRIYQNNKLASDFIVGSLSSDFSSSYVSRPGSSDTYATADFFNLFTQKDWRDPEIFSSDKEGIDKIRLQYSGKEFILEKKGSDWTASKPFKFVPDKEKIGKILDVMTGLSAVDIPEQTFKGTGLEKNSLIVEVSGGGTDNILMVGDKNKEGLYYAKRGNSDNIYLIGQTTVSDLESDLRKR